LGRVQTYIIASCKLIISISVANPGFYMLTFTVTAVAVVTVPIFVSAKRVLVGIWACQGRT
jgi:hypothetical protein